MTAGALHASDPPLLEAAGIKWVITLRADSEVPDVAEADAVRSAGMHYTQLPIQGSDDLTLETVQRFDRLIREANGQPTVILCASCSPVGALAALRAAWIEGRSTDDA